MNKLNIKTFVKTAPPIVKKLIIHKKNIPNSGFYPHSIISQVQYVCVHVLPDTEHAQLLGRCLSKTYYARLPNIKYRYILIKI